MGQTLSTLGGVVGYKHEHRTGSDGVAKTFVTVLDTSIFKRKIKLQLAIVHEPQEGEDVATGAAATGAAAVAAVASEDGEAAPRLDLIQEAVDDESTEPPADDDRPKDHELPPLAFVDEEDDNSSTTSSTKLYPQPCPSRRAFSTGTTDKAREMTRTPSRQSRRARPQSVGALSGTGGRLSVQTISDVVSIVGRNGQQRMMNRVRLSLHDQEEIILIPVGPPSREAEEGTEGELGGAGGEGKDKEDDVQAQRPRRYQSVTVSLEANEQLAEEGRARGEEEGEKGKEEEEQKLSVDIEQVEGLKPLGLMTHDAASAVATVTTNAELEAAILRLCSAYHKDEAAPTVVSHKRDIKIITGFLSRLILPASQANSNSNGSSNSYSSGSRNSKSSPSSHMVDVLPADLFLLNPSSSPPLSSPSSVSISSSSNTLIPPPPLSPHAYEPIIEKSSGGPTAATITAAAGKGNTNPSTSLFLRTNNGTDKQEEHKDITSQSGDSSTTPTPLIKTKRHRKIRLSASSFEQLQVSADDGGALFDDLWDVQPATAPSSSSSTFSPFSALRKLVKTSSARVTQKGYILPPDDDDVEEGQVEGRRDLIFDDEVTW